ncbi:epoxyqueuosine reductase QueH [Patescibacteria group bacterium]
MTFKPSLLLHVTHPTKVLTQLNKLLDEFKVTLLFFQAGPKDKVDEEKDEAGVQRVAELLKLNLLKQSMSQVSDRHSHNWRDGMARCNQCTEKGLERTATIADEEGYDFYSSLSIKDDLEFSRDEENVTGEGTSQFLSLIEKI